MTRLVVATGNAGKLVELHELLAGLPVELVTQSELGIADIAETGRSFVENALIKARHASAASGLPALADDSGLLVDSLHGAPGLHTARFAGPQATAADNIAKLLDELRNVPEASRGAHFHCVLALLRHPEDPAPLIASGSWHGRILTAPRGTGGFGYDPVFFDPTHGLSAAEMPAELKNRISHRGRALAALRAELEALPL
ncbi:MAG TPA: RdgB/HAM1 family non-canonical purine NTP pyrophosphatase [Xanthomonadaceae bacterium]|nr:RdgB/HAM1 family non-canonical purine NTP pyrophosphatase [Xanthomonadaceae bacterium]